VIGGKDFESVLSSLALKLAGLALDKAIQPVSNLLGNLVGGLFSAFGLANGGVVAGGAVKPFAQGGVVTAPTLFPLARGLGLMGEAGAEAVLPLARGADGALGVRTQATSPTVVNFNITTADADSFRKSEAQVTAMLARAVGRGRRAL
jgi:lambda family phage tail tape measure protein